MFKNARINRFATRWLKFGLDETIARRFRLGGLCMLGLGGLAAAVAAFSPALGLGEAEDFLLWRMAGLSRRSMLRASLLICIAGLGAIALPIIPGILASIVRRGGPILAHLPAGRRLLYRLPGVTSAVWRCLNRDWAVSLILLPFGVYVLAFLFLVVPGLPWVAPDSSSYVQFSAIRTLLYPVLLRILACLSDDPLVLIWPFAVLGVGVTILFAEAAQRLYRNVLVTVPAALSILFCWSLLEHAGFVLSDYPYFAAYTLALALAMFAFLRPDRGVLIGLGVAIGAAIAIRPVGIVLYAIPPFLALVHWARWRRLLLWLGGPLLAALLIQAAGNQALFGFFGISRFTGFPWAGNTALLLKPDTPTAYPELRDRVVAMAKPYRDAYYALGTARERYTFLIDSANPLIAETGALTLDYGNQKGLITYNDMSGQQALLQWVNGLSPLNKGLSKLPVPAFSSSLWQDEILLRLGREAHLANLGDLIEFMAVKLRFSWESMLPWFAVGEQFGHYRTLRLDVGDLGVSSPVPDAPRRWPLGLNVEGFDWVVSVLQKISQWVSVSGVILAVALCSLALLAFRLLRRAGPPSPELAATACLAACTILTPLMMSLAQIPIGRYLVVSVAGPALFLFLPLAAVKFIARIKAAGAYPD